MWYIHFENYFPGPEAKFMRQITIFYGAVHNRYFQEKFQKQNFAAKGMILTVF